MASAAPWSREAVAALRAEGLVNTRQGRGAFIAAAGSAVPFQVTPEEVSSLKDILNILELRATLEMEACGLAAERRTPAEPDPHRRGAGRIAAPA